jgi:membrane protein
MRRPLRQDWDRARRFLGEGIWDASPGDMPRYRALGYRLLRVSYLVGKGFAGNRCKLHASALTFTTLISLVPFLAFAFAVAKGLNVRSWLEAEGGPIDRLTVGQDVAKNLVEYVDKTDVRTLGALGLLTLIWTVIQLLSTIEQTFNEIWGVKVARTFFRKFSDYLSVVVVCPLLLAVAMMMTAMLESSAAVAWLRAVPWLGEGVGVLFRLLPYAAMWVAFTSFYLFMPNTRVPFLAALGGGMVAGTVWQLGQWLYVGGNVLLARYSPIYSTFASFPVFLIWLYLSWLIALFGAEVAFALQHERTYQREGRSLAASPADRERLALRIAGAVADRFRRGEKPWNVNDLAQTLDLPVRLVNDLGAELEAGGILTAIPGAVLAYHPARALEAVTLKQVLDAVRRYSPGSAQVSPPGKEGPGGAVAAEVVAAAEDALSGRLSGMTLDDLARGEVPWTRSLPSPA